MCFLTTLYFSFLPTYPLFLLCFPLLITSYYCIIVVSFIYQTKTLAVLFITSAQHRLCYIVGVEKYFLHDEVDKSLKLDYLNTSILSLSSMNGSKSLQNLFIVSAFTTSGINEHHYLITACICHKITSFLIQDDTFIYIIPISNNQSHVHTPYTPQKAKDCSLNTSPPSRYLTEEFQLYCSVFI